MANEWNISDAQSKMPQSEIDSLQTGNTRDLNFDMLNTPVATEGEGDSLSLDPVEVQKAASTVARAKKAMQYLKDALDVLKTGKNEKRSGEGIINGINQMNPAFKGAANFVSKVPDWLQNSLNPGPNDKGIMNAIQNGVSNIVNPLRPQSGVPQWLQNPPVNSPENQPTYGPENQDQEVLNYMDQQTQR